MAFISSGGSLVSSANIVDGAIVNADINAAAAIALSKLAGLIGNPGTFISFEQTDGVTASVTVDGSERVLVFATGDVDIGNANVVISLDQAGVVKYSQQTDHGSAVDKSSYMLYYTEVPAANTYALNVTQAGGGTLARNRFMVIKLRVA